MLKRLAKAYLRWRHGITEPWQRVRPPLGWLPWSRVSIRRRARYVLASRLWRVEERLRSWAFRGERFSDWNYIPAGTAGPPEPDPQPRAPFSLGPIAGADLASALTAAKSGTWVCLPEGVRVEAINLSAAAEPDYKNFDNGTGT